MRKRKDIKNSLRSSLLVLIIVSSGIFLVSLYYIKGKDKEVTSPSYKEIVDIEKDNDDSDKKIISSDSQGEIDITAKLLNIIEDDEDYILFELRFNTHSVDFNEYDFSKITTFKTSEGIEINNEIIWEANGYGHHFTGYYKIPKIIKDRELINEKTEFIELNIQGLGSAENRVLRWDKDALNLMFEKY